jgi:hypothetical protein
LWIVFLFVHVRTCLITYIDVNSLYTFYDVEDLLITTNCNISCSHTEKHSNTHINADLTMIPIKIMRDDLQNFTFFFCVFKSRCLYQTRTKQNIKWKKVETNI